MSHKKKVYAGSKHQRSQDLCVIADLHWVTTESVFLLHRRPKTQLKGRPNAQNPLSQKKSGQGGRVPLFRKKSCRTTQKHNAHTDLGGDFLFFFCCHLFKKVHKHNTNAKAQIKKMINVVTHFALRYKNLCSYCALLFVHSARNCSSWIVYLGSKRKC